MRVKPTTALVGPTLAASMSAVGSITPAVVNTAEGTAAQSASIAVSQAAAGAIQQGAPIGSPITTFTLTDEGSGAGRPVFASLTFAEGAVPQGSTLVVTDSNDNLISSQFSKLASWRTDNSVLHAIVVFETQNAGDNSGTYKVATGTPASGADISRADIAASAFDAVCQVSTGGSTYSLSAADCFDGTLTPLQDYPHVTGPKCSEYIVGGHLRLNGTGTEHPTLQAYFHVRAFGDPVDRARVKIILENTGVNRYSGNVTGDVTLSVGGSTVYTNNSFSIHADKRFPKAFWWGSDPQNYTDPDLAYLQSSKVVPKMRSLTPDTSGYMQGVDWLEIGQVPAAGTSPGAASHIGALDRWTAGYIMGGGAVARKAMLAAADVYHWHADSIGNAANPRDELTGFPIDPSDYPNTIGYDWGGANAMTAHVESILPTYSDLGHKPCSPYVQYLVTGDFNYLEQCQFWAVQTWFTERPGSESGWPRGFFQGQVRAVAWALRNMDNARVITPDAHPLAQVLDDAVDNALEDMTTRAIAADPNTLGFYNNGDSAVAYDPSDTPNPNDTGTKTGISPWHQAFLVFALTQCYERGFASKLNASGFLDRMAIPALEMWGEGDSGYCWADAGTYSIGLRDNDAGSIYASWPIITLKNFLSEDPSCLADGSALRSGDTFSEHYGAVQALAINGLMAIGHARAQTVWQRYEDRDISGWSSGYEENGQYAILPRVIVPPSSVAPAYLPGQTFTWARVNQAGSTVEATILADLGADTGHTDPGNIVGPWSGGTLYMKNGQPHLKVIGGGHGDSSYNGGPGINLALDSPSWFIEASPSPSSAIVQNSDTYSDGKPSSGHTYNLVTYMNGKTYLVGNTGRFPGTTGTQQIFEYNIASGVWVPRASNPTNYGPDGAVVAVEAAGRIWKIGQEQQATGYARLQYWDEATNSWTTAPGTNDSFAMANYVSIAYDPTRNQLFYFSSANGSGYAIYDIDTGTEERNFTRTGAFLAAENVMYDSVRDLYIGFNDAATQLYEMTPDARVTTLRALAGTPPQIETVHGHYGRAQFYAPYNAVYLLGSTTGDLKVLEVA